MYNMFVIFSFMVLSIVVTTFAWSEQMKQWHKSDSKLYSTRYDTNGGGAYQDNVRNVQGMRRIGLESNRNRKQVTGYYNPYNIHYIKDNKISNYRHQSTKRLTPTKRNNYNQSNRKQDFGFGNAQRRPRPTRKTTVLSQKKSKPLIALM